jgi:Holliday junction resolvase RusA-like endonuclease
MSISIMFTVYGTPTPKGRPRFSTRGKFPVAYTPEKTKTYEAEVGMMAKAAMGASKALEGALEAFIYVTFPVPASYSKKRTEACLNETEKHTKKPDLDNVVKSVIDGMDKIVFDNDSQIMSIHATKVYGEIAKVEVLVRQV